MTIESFNKIWCLHCVDHKDRYEISKKEFEKVGILDKVEYRWTSLQPIENLRQSNKLKHLKSEGEYHCTREHYTMIKIAYHLGWNYIMIFEDDVKFIKKEYFDKFMNNIPDNFDILRFGGAANTVFNNGPSLYNNGIYWSNEKQYLWCTIGYAMSRKAMKYYLSYIEKSYVVADMPLYDMNSIMNSGLNCYFSTLPICYYYKFDSSIQPNNDFDYKDRYYKNINMSLYE